ncbi:hypothetical protein ASPCAL09710 [Aspergillus calidoustus]|uniref:F-box domain-containing protein n=1 Tax=Aspergillus calidoustus TaxID=454130 RepID=A0A0U5CB98_ASPCI|nr:hypothetical protein ASPCAL09710 [Aspergillus calidoustus]
MPQPELLPEDVLHVILQHILHDHDHDVSPTPPHFYNVADWTEAATKSQKCPQRTRTLRSLMLTSRRLYALVKPLFYRDILVPQWNIEQGKHVTWTFYQCIARDPALRDLIHSAVLNTDHFRGYDLSSPVFAGRWQLAVYESPDERGSTPGELAALMETLFFKCANLRRLTVVEFNAWNALVDEDSETGFRFRPRTSPITHLTLAKCGAKERALTSLLAWPRALQTLHYDANQSAWAFHYDEEEDEEAEWTCAAFVRALAAQKSTLTELSLTRQTPDHERMFMGPRIDLSGFARLRVLRIFELFLVGVEPADQAWRGMPPNLEVLEVFYDDASYQGIRFFAGHPAEDRRFDEGAEHEGDGDGEEDVDLEEWWKWLWLRALLAEQGMGRFPALKTVRVYTTESEPESGYGRGRGQSMRLWKLPRCIRESARQAAVHVEVWLGADRSPGK